MTIRISTLSLQESIANTIAASSARAMKLQQGLGDGKAVRIPSDDPVRAHQAMWFQERLRANDQYQRNLDGVSSYLSNLESNLSQIQDAIGQVMSLQTSAGDDSLGPDERAALAVQVGQAMELLSELGNTRYAGNYVFGGTRTLDQPLLVGKDASGTVQSVSFNPAGLGTGIKRQVGPDLSLTISVKASDVFGENADLFHQLASLREALVANDGDKIRSFSSVLGAASDRVTSTTTSVGTLIERTDALKTQLTQQNTNYEAGRSAAEDLDMAKAIVQFQNEQVTMQAALSAGARLLSLNLLDFLK